MFNSDIAIRQFNPYREYQIALGSGTASSAQLLDVPTDQLTASRAQQQIISIEARGDNITFKFGAANTVTASNTIASNKLVDGNFSVPNGAVRLITLNAKETPYVSVQADTGGASIKAIIQIGTFN